VRTFISFPAGVARMPIRTFVAYSVAGAFLWSAVLTWAGVQLGERWEDIRHALQPFDLVIGLVVVAGLAFLLWLRLGRPVPGRRNRS
jgi:membrane protein DedA with SNARE-associated domain